MIKYPDGSLSHGKSPLTINLTFCAIFTENRLAIWWRIHRTTLSLRRLKRCRDAGGGLTRPGRGRIRRQQFRLRARARTSSLKLPSPSQGAHMARLSGLSV